MVPVYKLQLQALETSFSNHHPKGKTLFKVREVMLIQISFVKCVDDTFHGQMGSAWKLSQPYRLFINYVINKTGWVG